MPIMDVAAFLESVHLEKGAHQPDHTFCVLELAAYLAQEPWSDHPACVSPIIGAFLRSWNDAVDDDFRQQLKPYAAKVLHTNTGAAHEKIRAWLLTDWQVRVSAPTWLELVGLKVEAASLRALPIINNAKDATAATQTIRAAAKAASAAWDAAGDAVRDAAGDAAWDAVRDAAGDAAWDAVRDAAWDAAWDAVRDAAGDAAWDAARAAAWDAAWAAARAAAGAAAWDAAWDAAGDAAWAAAWDAATKRLAPTVTYLQSEAFKLLDALIAVSK